MKQTDENCFAHKYQIDIKTDLKMIFVSFQKFQK